MSDQRPVLVIHGVANHDQAAFERRVADFNAQVNQESATEWTFIPVFWGDLGAAEQGIEDTIPNPPLASLLGVRDDGEDDPDAISPADLEMLGALAAYRPAGAPAAAGGSQPVRSDEARREIVAEAARTRAAERVMVRADETAEALAEAIRASWGQVVYLNAIDDPSLLEAIGRAVASAVTPDGAPVGFTADDETEEPGGFAVRGDEDEVEADDYATRRPHPVAAFRQVVGSVVHGVDRAVGAVLGEVLGTVQDLFRRQVSHGVAGFLGDVLVYQRNQQKIQERLWSVIPAGWATDDGRAVDVIAHSLGGVIVFDAATTAARRLFVRRLVTFGSQPSFFQVVDPRAGLMRYLPGHGAEPAQTISLPPSIQSWQSLWEPLDPLAFLAGSVFRLSSQEAPTDAMVPHAATELWTHSAYWTSDFVVKAIRRALT